MPVVLFESAGGELTRIDAPGGTRLLDLCDDSQAPVPFSCRSASCGTCRVDVLEGIDLLERAADEELEVLDIFGDDPGQRRLACQARIGPRDGRLRLRAVPD